MTGRSKKKPPAAQGAEPEQPQHGIAARMSSPDLHAWRAELSDGARSDEHQSMIAGYVFDMLGELHDLADGADLVLLAYLVDMAREEAASRR